MKLFQFQHKDQRPSDLTRVTGCLAMLLLSALVYLGSSPAAHEYFHADAGHPDHVCAVTSFAAGEVFYLVPLIDVRPAAAVVRVERLYSVAQEARPEAPEFFLLPICGPPARV